MTILWLIERLLVKPTEGSNTDVVITADWRCNGTETTGSGDTEKSYSGTCYGSCSFAPPTGSFTPYPDLTQEQVLGWCYANGVDQAAIEFAAASGGNWGSIGWAGIFDASTSGNLLAWAPLSTARTINDGDVLRIPATSLSITLA